MRAYQYEIIARPNLIIKAQLYGFANKTRARYSKKKNKGPGDYARPCFSFSGFENDD